MRKGKSLLKRLRNKLVFLLLVYFAGFATAVYYLVPLPQNEIDRSYARRFASDSGVRSDEFVISFSKGLRQCIELGKSAALYTGDLIKEIYDQRKSQADS